MPIQDNAKELLNYVKGLDLSKKEDRDKFLNKSRTILNKQITHEKEKSKTMATKTLSPLQKEYRK